MDTTLVLTKSTAKQLYLDPRTKIFMCVTISLIMLTSAKVGMLQYLQMCLSVVPFIFLLVLKKFGVAAYYAGAYIFLSIVPGMLIPYLPPILNLLFTGVLAFSTRLLPGMSMAYFLIVTTSVSEFVAAMDRMHVSKKISIPFSVMFRFFPTIIEEYKAISDAMRLREVVSLRNPLSMLEYRMVPLLMSIVSIGNDLSASALTRGLDAPNRRTNVCPIGFGWCDYIAFTMLTCSIIVYILEMLS